MSLEISAISNADAQAYFEKHSAFRGEFDLAISANETILTLQQALARIEELKRRIEQLEAVPGNVITHGVIAVSFDGHKFEKRHISTDGNALIGSVLYGAMVRNAMSAGYKQITV
jgi:malate synthase